MAYGRLLTTREVRSLFETKVAALGGTVREVVDDGSRLFARGVLPRFDEVQRGDRLDAGVALRAGETGVVVHPYTFREVCKNGAILATSLESRDVRFADLETPEEAAEQVAEAIASCAEPGAFAEAVGSMRTARRARADMLLNLMTMLGRSTGLHTEALFREILDRFFADGDDSAYGLFNAVTAVARDQSDPEAKWGLERLGGGVLVAAIKPQPHFPDAAEVEELVVV